MQALTVRWGLEPAKGGTAMTRPVAGRRGSGPVLLSAHRGGCGRAKALENTFEAFEAAARMPVEFVEFDVQRTRDGVLVINHDDEVRWRGRVTPIGDLSAAQVDEVLGTRVRFEEILVLLAGAGRRAHIDLKFVSPRGTRPSETFEVAAVQVALAVLGPDGFIVTTTEDRSVRAVRDWADTAGVDLVVGLSIGRHRLRGMSRWERLAWRVGELFPDARIARSRANLVVAQRHLARARLLAMSARRGLPVLVWTVDNEREMARLLGDSRVWMITSNFPERASGLRLPAAA